MPSWNTLLIIIISVFLAALVWSLYRTLKSIYQTDSLIIEKALKQNDANLNSFSMAPAHYLKRRFSHPQRDFAESFMELSKEQPSTKTAAVSTSTLIERPKGRDEIADNLHKSDRSMDFLLFATTRRACANSTKISHRIDGIDLDSSFHKIKSDLEKPSNDNLKDEINQIEKEIYSMSRFDLFKASFWSELKHYHYILALLSGNSREKPLRHHASHNSALYLIIIFVFTMASSIMGSENLTTLNLLIVGCIALVALIPLAINCYQSTEQDTCSVEYLLAQKTPEDSIETKTINYISQAQQKFGKKNFSLFFHILGIAAGIASFSQVQRLEVLISPKFLTSLALIVGVDILVVRNLVVTVLTLAATSSLKERLVKAQIRSLIQVRCFSPATVVAENMIEVSAKKLYMTEKETRENHRSMDNSCEMIQPTTLAFGNNSFLPSFRGTKENNKSIIPSIITTLNDVEENRSKRQRTMSFSEKDKYENLLMNPHIPHDEHIKTQMEDIPELKRGDEHTLSIEDLGVAQKLSGMKQITHFPLQGIAKNHEDVSTGIDTQNQDQSNRRLRRMDWKNKFYSQKSIEIPEQSAESTPFPHPNEGKIKTPKEFTSSMRFFEELEAALNTSIEKKRQEDASPKNAELPQFSYQELHSRSQTDSQIASKTDIHNHHDSTASNILYHLKGLESAKKLDRPANSCFNGPKSSIVISGTTLASLNHDRSKHRSSIENLQGEKPSLTGTPRSFTPSIANFDHDRGSQKAFPEYGSIYSRLSAAGDSQPELKNDIENLKHMTKQNENFIEGRTESDLGDFDNNGKYEYRLSGRDFRNRDVTLRPIQENGYIVRDRNKRQITENDIEESLEVTDLAYKGGKVVGDETDLKRRRVVQRVPLRVERSRYESAEKPKIRKLGQAAGYVDSKSYFDKPTSTSKGYGYNFGFNVSSHHDSKFKPRKCVSVDREDEEDIDQIRLPKLNKTNNQGGDRKGEKKVIQSLNKVPSFPELKGTSTMIRSQVI